MIYLPHVMWQPFFRCEANCPGCYLKGSGFVEDQRLFPHFQLMSAICNREVVIGELIVSVDKVKKITRGKQLFFLKAFQLPLVGRVKSLQLAARDPQTVDQILDISPYILQNLDSIALSRVDYSSRIHSWKKENPRLKIIWNLLATKKACYYWAINPDAMLWRAESVDIIHMILEKDPLGQEIDTQKPRNFLRLALLIGEHLELRNKVHIDRCCSREPSKTACKDQIHIWPDGSVTCCPYDSNGVVHDQPGGIIENIRNALRSPSPFESHCKLR